MGHVYHRKLFSCPWVTHHLHLRNIAPSAPIQYGTPPYSCTRVLAFTSLGVKSTLLLPSPKLQTTWFHGWVAGLIFHLLTSQITMEHEPFMSLIYLSESNMVTCSICIPEGHPTFRWCGWNAVVPSEHLRYHLSLTSVWPMCTRSSPIHIQKTEHVQ